MVGGIDGKDRNWIKDEGEKEGTEKTGTRTAVKIKSRDVACGRQTDR